MTAADVAESTKTILELDHSITIQEVLVINRFFFRAIWLTWGGATAGGVLYSLEPLLRLPPVRTAWGGVGGLVVGAGPTMAPEIPVVDTEPRDCMLPWLEPRCFDLGVPPVDVVLTPWPMSSRAVHKSNSQWEHFHILQKETDFRKMLTDSMIQSGIPKSHAAILHLTY